MTHNSAVDQSIETALVHKHKYKVDLNNNIKQSLTEERNL